MLVSYATTTETFQDKVELWNRIELITLDEERKQ